MLPFYLDPAATAILVMDVQNDIVSLLPGPVQQGVLASIGKVVEVGRAAGCAVIYIVVQFREGYPELSPRNKRLSDLPGSGRLVEGTPGAQVHPAIAPRPGELVIHKRRVNSFYGTELPVVLAARNIHTLVLMGIATNFVVEGTARHGADADYNVIVVSNGCASWRKENHDFAMKYILPSLAWVVSADELVRLLGQR